MGPLRGARAAVTAALGRLSVARAPLAALTLTAVLAAVAPREADAKVAYDSAYGFERTWNAAVRLVRVDMGWKLTEKDEATGYLLFEYRSSEGGAKPSAGSIEIVRAPEPHDPVKVVVQLPQMPRYHEQVLVDSLIRKLRADYGEPPPRPAPSTSKRKPVVDAGADAEP